MAPKAQKMIVMGRGQFVMGTTLVCLRETFEDLLIHETGHGSENRRRITIDMGTLETHVQIVEAPSVNRGRSTHQG